MLIDRPCHESWSAMQPAVNGRNCLHCRSFVADFTTLSNEEILSQISAGKMRCGTFHFSQLVNLPSFSLRLMQRLAIPWLTFWFLCTQLRNVAMAEHRVYDKEWIEQDRAKLSRDSGVVMPGFIRGVLINEETKRGLGGIHLQLCNGQGEVLADSLSLNDGSFLFQNPEGASGQQPLYLLVSKQKKKYRLVKKKFLFTKIDCEIDTWVVVPVRVKTKKRAFKKRVIMTGKFR